jgi:ubiquinone/menaquinone biosynthesis C-methylase UbiE
MRESKQKLAVQESFTRQAEMYAVAPAVADPDRIARFLNAVDPRREWRILDVACGPVFLALALAERCREAIGIDLTDAPLKIAERKRDELGLKNVRFLTADAEHIILPRVNSTSSSAGLPYPIRKILGVYCGR